MQIYYHGHAQLLLAILTIEVKGELSIVLSPLITWLPAVSSSRQRVEHPATQITSAILLCRLYRCHCIMILIISVLSKILHLPPFRCLTTFALPPFLKRICSSLSSDLRAFGNFAFWRVFNECSLLFHEACQILCSLCGILYLRFLSRRGVTEQGA